MQQDEMSSDQGKANTEYYRKLNQQIVQKDNIIKLLQLKLKNLEANAGSEGADLEDDDRKGTRKKALQERDERIRELGIRVTDLEKLRDRLEADLAHSREDLAQSRDDVATKERTLADLRDRPPVENVVQTREIERLRNQVFDQNKELERVKEELRNSQTTERWPGNSDPILRDDLTAAERNLAQAREEVATLKTRITDLESRPEADVPRIAMPAGDTLPLVQAVIGMLQLFDGIDATQMGEASMKVNECKAQLTRIAKLIGIERIPTAGRTFDMKLHQAVEMVYSGEHPHSTVLREVTPGYSASGAVVRLADVIVSLNPYYCTACEKVAVEGSRFCHTCGSRVVGKDKEGVRVLDDRASCLSHVELAASQEKNGNTEGARAHYSKALAVDPRNVRALAGLARVAELNGNYEEALSFHDQLAPLSPDVVELARARERIVTKMEILEKLRTLG